MKKRKIKYIAGIAYNESVTKTDKYKREIDDEIGLVRSGTLIYRVSNYICPEDKSVEKLIEKLAKYYYNSGLQLAYHDTIRMLDK